MDHFARPLVDLDRLFNGDWDSADDSVLPQVSYARERCLAPQVLLVFMGLAVDYLARLALWIARFATSTYHNPVPPTGAMDRQPRKARKVEHPKSAFGAT